LTFENKVPEIKENIDNVSAIINQSLFDLRNLTKSLTNNDVENENLSQLISNECEKINKLKKCNVFFEDYSITKFVPYQTKNIIYRITQEFFHNSLKYADCKTITAVLNENKDFLILNLVDDGKGFDINNNSSFGIGLKNIKTRTKILEGNFDFESIIGKGTKLKIEIPIVKKVD
jgi:signal transduction histidine kinase